MNEVLIVVGGSIISILLTFIGFSLRQFYSGIKEMKTSLSNLRLDVKLYNAELTRNRKDLMKLEIRVDENEDKISANTNNITKIASYQENCPALKK